MTRNGKYVQYGCGLSAPATWRNFDASPTLRLQRLPIVGQYFRGGSYPLFPATVEFGDIVQGLPVEPGSCKAVFCSHTLEHLTLDDFRAALRNTLRYLEPGGTFRLVVPDLEHLSRSYLGSSEADAALKFMEDSNLGRRNRPTGFGGMLREWLGHSSHLWMWDFKAISRELGEAGFRNIRRAEFGDSLEPRFKDVEDADRWQDCLGVECIK
jgi:hypothetical protein